MIYFSDFVATKILHELYELCCGKRFRANIVEKAQPIPRSTLYKYLTIPKECKLPPAVSDVLTETTDESPAVQPSAKPRKHDRE